MSLSFTQNNLPIHLSMSSFIFKLTTVVYIRMYQDSDVWNSCFPTNIVLQRFVDILWVSQAHIEVHTMLA